MKKIYFIGIGGIGMSALARYYNSRGYKVYGYDKTETALTKKLVKECMTITFEDNIDDLIRDVEMVVYTPAIPIDHLGLNWYQEHGYKVLKRAEVLGVISLLSQTIGIAGTHGKTTTSSMLAHVLHYCKFDFTAFLGGISVGFDSNFIEGSSDYVLLEADEYDRSFLHLKPTIATLMSIDSDHLDIYGSEEGMLDGFRSFTYGIESGGKLFIKDGCKQILGAEWESKLLERQIEIVEFGVGASGVCISNVHILNGWQVFDITYKGKELRGVKMLLAGSHNIENAGVAIGIALELGLDAKLIKESLVAFKGIKRRFEFVVREASLVIIDDYAHHPTELEASITAVQTLYPNKRILGVFQPHLYSRTNDFYSSFAKSLDLLGEVVLLDIYPAREEPMIGVSSKLIYDEMKVEKKHLVNKNELINKLKALEFEVLLILGAGDIGALVDNIAVEIKKHKLK